MQLSPRPGTGDARVTRHRPGSGTSRPDHRGDIDGLRAVAVVAVLLYHAGLGMPGGYVGVDVFFVISGYLIASILIDEGMAGRISLLGFFERRARRLLPALLAVLVAVSAVGTAFLTVSGLVQLGREVQANLLLAPNIHYYLSVGYFDTDAQLKPLLHTWSLGIEAQFYLSFPFLIVALMRFGLLRHASLIFAALSIASFALAIRWELSPEAVFYLPQPRVWELGLGAVLAAERARLARIPGALAEVLALAGLAAIVAAALLYDSTTPFPGIAALLPCLGTAALIAAGSAAGDTRVGRVLAMRPMVALGKLSYSLYLWHWPVIVFARYFAGRDLTAAEGAAALALSAALASVSYTLIETPVRRRQILARPRMKLIALVASAAALGAFALAVYKTEGLPGRLPAEVRQLSERPGLAAPGRECHLDNRTPLTEAEICVRGDPDATSSFVLIGDSHAQFLAHSVFEAARLAGRAGHQITVPSFRPPFGRFGRYSGASHLDAWLARHPEVETLIITGFWAQYATGYRARVLPAPTSTDVFNERRRDALTAALTEFVQRHPDRRILLLDDVPLGKELDMRLRAQALMTWRTPLPDHVPRSTIDLYRSFYMAALAETAEAHPHVELRDVLTDALCDGPVCPAMSPSGRGYYIDTDHLAELPTAPRLIGPLREALFSDEGEAPR